MKQEGSSNDQEGGDVGDDYNQEQINQEQVD